jgi:hypothetical protein
MSDFMRVVQQRALKSGDPALLQVGFNVAVLERYRGDARYRVMRTETVARVQQERGWSLDVGISPGEETLHTSWAALTTALPEEEREHWASHAAPVEAYSEMFLRMQLSPSSCFDDGELRAW